MKNTIKAYLKKIQDKLHICVFSKPIISRYVGYSTRDIIYQCRCGKRAAQLVCRPSNMDFPIDTSIMLSHKEFQDILNGNIDPK